jgi:hypothetical protein
MFVAVAVPTVLLTLAVGALWRRNRVSLAIAVALIGLAAIGTWLVLTWKVTGIVIFGALLAAWMLSPYLQRVYRHLWS